MENVTWSLRWCSNRTWMKQSQTGIRLASAGPSFKSLSQKLSHCLATNTCREELGQHCEGKSTKNVTDLRTICTRSTRNKAKKLSHSVPWLCKLMFIHCISTEKCVAFYFIKIWKMQFDILRFLMFLNLGVHMNTWQHIQNGNFSQWFKYSNTRYL